MWQNLGKVGRQQPTEITAEVQGNYPNFRKRAKKTVFIPNVKANRPLFVHGRPEKTRFQKMTTRALSKEIRIWRQEFFPETVFSRIFLSGNSTKSNYAHPESRKNNKDSQRVNR